MRKMEDLVLEVQKKDMEMLGPDLNTGFVWKTTINDECVPLKSIAPSHKEMSSLDIKKVKKVEKEEDEEAFPGLDDKEKEIKKVFDLRIMKPKKKKGIQNKYGDKIILFCQSQLCYVKT